MTCLALIWRLSAAFAVKRFPSGSFLKGQAPTGFSIWQDRFGNGRVRFINPIPTIQRTDARSRRPPTRWLPAAGIHPAVPKGLRLHPAKPLTPAEPPRATLISDSVVRPTHCWFCKVSQDDCSRAGEDSRIFSTSEFVCRQSACRRGQCLDSRGGDGFPWRDLPGAEELGEASLPQAHLLFTEWTQAAATLLSRDPCRVSIATLIIMAVIPALQLLNKNPISRLICDTRLRMGSLKHI
jgi:hypothetical protein